MIVVDLDVESVDRDAHDVIHDAYSVILDVNFRRTSAWSIVS
jgi:hypothetical protein